MIETTDYLQMLVRMIRAGAKRVGDGDEEELSKFVELGKYLNLKIAEAAREQVKQGKGWSDIGRSVGTSKQAAFKKYAQGKNSE